jgi:chorismate synthase
MVDATTDVRVRGLGSLADLACVVDLEKKVWELPNGDDTVPVNLLAASVRRGAILLGAFDRQDLVGFVYAFPAISHGRLVQWSHMLAVLPEWRARGLGCRLKLAQRDRAIAQGIDTIEWTFDPLQAANAHFNFARLGVTAGEYLHDVYGVSDSPLHRGTPTDRLVVAWDLLGPRAVARATGGSLPGDAVAALASSAVPVNRSGPSGEWRVPAGEPDLGIDEPALLAEIPPAFTRMLAEATGEAQAWRITTRGIFDAYFARGYRAVEFLRDGEGGGRYLLVRPT